METLTVQELCDWLQITPQQLRDFRRRRDGTKFPPPLLGDAGLVWYEHDVCQWVCFLSDWKDAGATREALEEIDPPCYLAVEPEDRTCARRGLN